MPTKNHAKSMSAPERKFWTTAVIVLLNRKRKDGYYSDLETIGHMADELVAMYRHRITWRQP